MSEMNERNLENTAPEAADEKLEIEAISETTENENAPGVEAKENIEKKKRAGKKKKRRRAKVALPAVAVLLIIALLFGVVVGYAIGRSAGAQRLRDAQVQIDVLTEAVEDAAGAPAYSDFNEALTSENQSALDDLSGRGFEGNGVSELAGDEALLGQVLEGSERQSVVVAEYAGGTIMSDEAAEEYEAQLASLLFSGYSEAEVSEALLEHVLQTLVSERILEEKAQEMGLYELTEADQAAIDAQAQHEYEEQLAFYRAFVNTDGMTEEEASGAVKSYLEQNEGMTLESLRAEIKEAWWMQKLYDEMTDGAAVDAAQLQAAYDELVAQQKADFEANAGDYEFAQASGETIVYNLSGYRAVRMLMFAIEDEETLETVSVLREEMETLDEQEMASCQAKFDACYAAVEQKAEDALEQLRGGADFDALLDAGDDAGMLDAALRESGYSVSANSTLWPAEMIEAAMALENPGDYSGIVRLEDGVCILQYVGEVAAGEVPLEDVKDALEESVLQEERYALYSAQLDEWLEEANVVYYPERMH